MKKLLLKYKLFLIYLFISVWAAPQSTVVNEVLHFPLILNRLFTVLSYLPFILFILWKVICDLKERKIVLSDILFYTLALYYVAVSIYRILNHMEVKENLYYSIIMFGSLAMCMQITAGKLPISNRDLIDNVIAVGIFLTLFRFTDRLVLRHYLAHPAINVNITTGVTALIIPLLFDACCEKEITKKQLLIRTLTLLASLVVIATTGSRSIFLLSILILIVMIVFRLKTGMIVKRILPVVFCSVVIVGAMAAMNIGEVRYSLYRETTLSFFSDKEDAPANNSGTTTTEPADNSGTTTTEPADNNGTTTTEPPAEVPPQNSGNVNHVQDSANQQTNRSDKMRSDLVKMGIEQIKLNPLFGTGDVEYPYGINETYAPMQSSHNFIIESLICYGAVGTALLLMLLASLVFETKLIKRAGVFHDMFALIMTMAFFFGFGMVQPIVYNYLVTPLFAWIFAYYKQSINGMEMK